MVAAPLLIVGFFAALFIGFLVVMAKEAAAANKDFAAENPDDPFSKGVDAAWKGKGLPPSKQDRSSHIRSALFWNSLQGAGRLSPTQREEVNKRADAVAARAKALRDGGE